MSRSTFLLKGSCLCSKTAFTSSKFPLRLTHCHCIPCRKLSGGAFTTWADFPSSAISWAHTTAAAAATTTNNNNYNSGGSTTEPTKSTDGKPTLRRSSKIATRGFCESCGSTVSMQYDIEPEVVGLAAGLIDDDFGNVGEVLKMIPQKHIFLKEKAEWFEIDRRAEGEVAEWEGFSEDWERKVEMKKRGGEGF
ncbi:hypothetical protein AJ78_00377 [Emergomyces pasteurianus Ep9510]|uniref:CENP-V/GFA domain-containing protein n=1 Tax=Emergomyces pasteurianus Ep9510 TaxID=1447872 RepID=A0A1J9QWG8_9EURO|nr:hypothetical protein AJ78_00377 [Emergomyces pasteurianus Ep9510]